MHSILKFAMAAGIAVASLGSTAPAASAAPAAAAAPADAQRHGYGQHRGQHVFNSGARRTVFRTRHYRGGYGNYYRSRYYRHSGRRACWHEWRHHHRVTICRRHW